MSPVLAKRTVDVCLFSEESEQFGHELPNAWASDQLVQVTATSIAVVMVQMHKAARTVVGLLCNEMYSCEFDNALRHPSVLCFVLFRDVFHSKLFSQ